MYSNWAPLADALTKGVFVCEQRLGVCCHSTASISRKCHGATQQTNGSVLVTSCPTINALCWMLAGYIWLHWRQTGCLECIDVVAKASLQRIFRPSVKRWSITFIDHVSAVFQSFAMVSWSQCPWINIKEVENRHLFVCCDNKIGCLFFTIFMCWIFHIR